MSKALLFLANGFEEIEALATVDILRRAGINLETVSIENGLAVTSARSIEIKADKLFKDLDADDFDMLILPGGPGHVRLKQNTQLIDLILKSNEEGKLLAAICASPTIFGMLGLLEGKKATCFPSMEDGLKGAVVSAEQVVTDGNITTGQAAGSTIAFALRLVSLLKGEETSSKVKSDIHFKN